MSISLKKSLERLETNWIDIYQYHGWDSYGNISEILSTMQKFVNDGSVLYPAISNFSAWQIAEFQARAEERGLAMYESAQMNYSLLNRGIEYEVIPYLKRSKMSLLTWSTLHGGLLTGKYKRDEKPPKGSRMGDRGSFSSTLMRKEDWI